MAAGGQAWPKKRSASKPFSSRYTPSSDTRCALSISSGSGTCTLSASPGGSCITISQQLFREILSASAEYEKSGLVQHTENKHRVQIAQIVGVSRAATQDAALPFPGEDQRKRGAGTSMRARRGRTRGYNRGNVARGVRHCSRLSHAARTSAAVSDLKHSRVEGCFMHVFLLSCKNEAWLICHGYQQLINNAASASYSPIRWLVRIKILNHKPNLEKVE